MLYQLVLLQNLSGNDALALDYVSDGMARFGDFADLALLGGAVALKQHHLALAQHYFETARKLGSAQAIAPLEDIRRQQQDQNKPDSP